MSGADGSWWTALSGQVGAPSGPILALLALSVTLVCLLPAIDLAGYSAALDRWVDGARGDAQAGAGPGAGGTRESAAGTRQRGRHRAPPDGAALSLLVTEVASRLESGAPVEAAWRESWERAGAAPAFTTVRAGVPEVVEELAHCPLLRQVRGWAEFVRWWRSRTWRGREAMSAARALRAACVLTHELGAPLASVLTTVAEGIDEAEVAADARRVAASGPATSARTLTAMPFLGLVGAQVLDADPVGFLFDGSVGTLCLVVGVGCVLAGHGVSQFLLRRAAAVSGEPGIDRALLCDLAAAGLEAGASVPSVLEALGGAAQVDNLARAGRQVRLGASWAQAWQGVHPGAADLGRALEAAWADGISPVSLLGRTAAQVRARRAAEARVEAERLGVRLVLPLGVFLLPAFVLLGVAPVLAHLGADTLSSPLFSP
ncbi:type II secretion system F family protein [Schaalia sp. 19OD2882]|uniref:type II secretion system F family protein n=1 Tax=Schaalia sp. 19OD2882 TaxID=2794089 RepID=UPI001C1EA771|nr:type II secretion system F family protein [Schaalia sp. 19OD2882]QWW19721.1 type II secretion system F family protein [Schaalia sp. 19OD2882]